MRRAEGSAVQFNPSTVSTQNRHALVHFGLYAVER
jgi:hypothetical protein